MKSIEVQKANGLKGIIKVPGDKSISHRMIIFASIAKGVSQLKGLLLGEDVLATMQIMQDLGVKMSHRPCELGVHDTLEIQGVGLNGLKPTDKILDCGNSGTSMRLLLGLLAGQNFTSTLTGDVSLNKRPMGRVIDPLTLMGAKFETIYQEEKRLIKVTGSQKLKNIHYQLPVASAQIKSALLLASLTGEGKLVLSQPQLSRDHTERFLSSQFSSLKTEGLTLQFEPQGEITAFQAEVPTDISSAAFFLVAGLIVPNSEIILKEVGINPTRNGIIEVLKRMGGDLEVLNQKNQAGEMVADIKVKSSVLKGVEVAGEIIPNIIDELPILFIASSVAKGFSIYKDIKELRVKESDRLAVMSNNLRELGLEIDEKADSLKILGGEYHIKNQIFESHHDHRMAMSMAICALNSSQPFTIKNIDCISTSFPGFFDLLDSLRV